MVVDQHDNDHVVDQHDHDHVAYYCDLVIGNPTSKAYASTSKTWSATSTSTTNTWSTTKASP